MVKIGLPLKTWGGKAYLADKIIGLMPKHLTYVELFFGTGAVLFAKPYQGTSEIVNDISRELTTFWRVLQNPKTFEEFSRRVACTPFSQIEFRDAVDFLDKEDIIKDEVDVAVAFFVRCRQSREGRGHSFATMVKSRTRREMNECCAAYLTAINGLPAIHDRLKRVLILNDDAVKVIQQIDNGNTVFYADPPYVHSTRVTKDAYEYEMSDQQHKELLDTLCDLRGKFLLSGYHSDLYDDYATQQGWNTHEFPIDCKPGNTPRVEVVWTNF